MTIFSAAFLLFLVMDPFGNVPLFLSVLSPIAAERRRRVIIRELLLALAALIIFLFLGRYILSAIGVSESILTTAGGVILFLIALRMIFPPVRGPYPVYMDDSAEEPILVPLAIPLLAGPSALASLARRCPDCLRDDCNGPALLLLPCPSYQKAGTDRH